MSELRKERSSTTIVLIGPYPPPYGGVSVHIQRLKERLLDVGFKCVVINVASSSNRDDKTVLSTESDSKMVRSIASSDLRYSHSRLRASPRPQCCHNCCALDVVCSDEKQDNRHVSQCSWHEYRLAKQLQENRAQNGSEARRSLHSRSSSRSGGFEGTRYQRRTNFDFTRIPATETPH